MQNFLIDYVGLIIGIISVIVSIIIYTKSRTVAQLIIKYQNIREIDKLTKTNSKISLLYEGKEVPRVTKTRIWLWNKGRRPIKKEDIPKEDPLSIVIKDVQNKEEIKLLDSSLQRTSNIGCKMQYIINDISNEIVLSFDYFDYKDGAIIEIQHTGSIRTKLNFRGTIIGLKKKTIVEEVTNTNSIRYLNATTRMCLKQKKTAKLLFSSTFIASFICNN